MHVMLDRDVPRINAMLKRMTEHLEEYLRGGQESEQLMEILGTASSMRRAGDDEAPAESKANPAGSSDDAGPTPGAPERAEERP
jgi:hypothetical protein